MREIISRGKGKGNGEWVVGIYIPVRHRDDNSHIHAFIMPLEHCVDKSSADLRRILIEVDPETVGQYTGLTDKNGTKIFEGDIIEHHAQGDLIVVRGIVNWDADNARWAYQLATMNPCFTFYNPDAFEVVGNIHDNPELLTEERT